MYGWGGVGSLIGDLGNFYDKLFTDIWHFIFSWLSSESIFFIHSLFYGSRGLWVSKYKISRGVWLLFLHFSRVFFLLVLTFATITVFL